MHPNLRTRRSVASCATLVLALAACGERARPPAARVESTPPSGFATPPPAVANAHAAAAAAIGGLLLQAEEGLGATKQEREVLAKIYPASSTGLLWVGADSRPTASATETLALFSDAASEGLDPEDYRATALGALRTTMEKSPAAPSHDLAAFDLGLSLSMLRYLRHFHRGRVNPRDIGFRLTLPLDEHDYEALVRQSATPGRVKETILSMTPPLVQYRSLRAMLPRYRELARGEAEGAFLASLGPAALKSLKPGEASVSLEALRTRLISLGDLPPNAAPLQDAGAYEGELVEGVKRFQIRHGLEGDGVLGKSTWTELSVPFAWRVRQIELAMERMRWLPHLGERAFVAVNIPMFRLWGWDSVPETGAPNFAMGVIVGKALNTRTPVFLEEMKYLIFQPYWNVPKSILQKEILPILRRDLGYLDRQDMEMVEGQSDEAEPVAATSTNLELLSQGKLRLRQRPGPKNALGAVKFMFPNDENVYLHSTPAPELFGRARRDFSHGCVRVEDPLALALWALQDQPDWTTERIRAAMKGRPSQRVPLTRPIRVVLYYVTATVIPAPVGGGDNSMHFAADIYGQDGPLDRALSTRKPSS